MGVFYRDEKEIEEFEKMRESIEKLFLELEKDALDCLKSKDRTSLACTVLRSKIRTIKKSETILDDIMEFTDHPKFYTEDFIRAKFQSIFEQIEIW